MNKDQPVIHLKNVNLSFGQSGFHMNNLDLSIQRGEFVGLR